MTATAVAAAMRQERDSFGPIEVPIEALWGAQTQRSLRFFAIGEQRMPLSLIRAMAQIKRAAAEVNASLGLLDPAKALAMGGTAVGNGMGAPAAFGELVVRALSARLGLPLTVAANRLAATAGHEALVALHAALRLLAVALIKLGGDLRLMGSGPRAGLGELVLPANEPGSSIMPGKVNPTQIEALLMVCQQVMGHDVAIGIAASQGQLELNTCKPLIAYDVLDSKRLLTDAMTSLAVHCIEGLSARSGQLRQQLERSLMVVTALSPHIGYEAAAHIAQRAWAEGLSVREAALALQALSAAEFDAWVDPLHMLGPDAWPAAPASLP